MRRFKGAKGIVLLLIFVLVGIGFYYYLSDRIEIEQETEIDLTVVQELLLKDLDKKYPPSPKEVVKLYSELTRCFYAEEYSEEELYDMAQMSYQLFDKDLALHNPFDNYYAGLLKDIAYYKDNSYIMTAYTTSSSVDIENAKFEKDGYTCTKVYCYYTMRYATQITTITEVFVLRKDESGYWKIYGWDLVDENE